MSAPRSQVSRMTENEWTVMVFFAGDPRLSPSMTAQLKALKDAGFQDQTTVLVHYDPNEKRVATTIFEINRARKNALKKQGETATNIGDGTDPFVRNLIEDRIEKEIPKTANATDALKNFLTYGLETNAKHYLIFLVGHGVIVGNDFFLPDHHPEETGITLKNLGEILHDFQSRTKGKVELIGLHSCSMSAMEVAYELKGAAKYMLATEGSSFVTSWPYRQLMKKILNAVQRQGENVEVDPLVRSIQQLSLHNSKDFMFSGLSADVCLCSLEPSRVDDLTTPVQDLTKALKAGLNDERGLELIKLAHLQSQSYFEETYTDLYDFCLCLERQCKTTDPVQKNMRDACGVMRGKLEEGSGNVIIQADFFGPVFQYSHGLSVFFPWARPIEDDPLIPGDTMLGRYEKYKFTEELKDDSWLSFLNAYFSKTMRDSREVEDKPDQESRNGTMRASNIRAEITVGAGGSTGANGSETLASASVEKPNSTLDKPNSSLDKPNSSLEGGGCGCLIKNYPMQFSIRSVRAKKEYSPDESAAAQAQTQSARVTR